MAWSGVFEDRLVSLFPQNCAKGTLAFYKEARLDVGTLLVISETPKMGRWLPVL